MPSATSCATLRCVAAFHHICRFIAGATSNGHSRARHSVDSRSSAAPCASLRMKSAVAGATTIASAPREIAMWPIALSAPGLPQIGQHRAPGQRLECHRRDEARAGVGEDHVDGDAVLDEQSHELGGLVRGDAAGHAEHDA